jgi:hypothetical protein
MTAVPWIAVGLGLALGLTGCNIIPSRPPGGRFFAARAQDCKPGAEIPYRDNFAAGEVPAMVLVNYAGRTVTIRVNDAITGTMFYNNTVYVPENRTTVWWNVETLITGTYEAELLMGGTLVQTCHFAVNNPTPRRRSPAPR